MPTRWGVLSVPSILSPLRTSSKSLITASFPHHWVLLTSLCSVLVFLYPPPRDANCFFLSHPTPAIFFLSNCSLELTRRWVPNTKPFIKITFYYGSFKTYSKVVQWIPMYSLPRVKQLWTQGLFCFIYSPLLQLQWIILKQISDVVSSINISIWISKR